MANAPEELGVLLNKVRVEKARAPLKKSEALTAAAQKHADDMRVQNYFSHTGKNGSSHQARIKKENYIACYTAENIAKGQKTASAVMQSWMKSKGHRTNNLNPRAKEYGVGRAGNIWVLVLAAEC